MLTFEVVVGAAIAALVGFQAWLTAAVFRNNLYERKQKIMQAQLIWFVPVLGSALVYTVLRDDGVFARAKPAPTEAAAKQLAEPDDEEDDVEGEDRDDDDARSGGGRPKA